MNINIKINKQLYYNTKQLTMRTGYSTIANSKVRKNHSFYPSKISSNSSFYNNTKGGSIINSQKYSKKSSSLDKSFLHKKNNSESILSTSKHINSKKLASSQYSKSSMKTDYNSSFNFQGNNSQYLNQRNQTTSFLTEEQPIRKKTKDRIITELKANFNQDKLRKTKLLSVNMDMNDNYNSFLENKESNTLNKSNLYTDKKEQPYKLYAATQNNQNETDFNISFSRAPEPNETPDQKEYNPLFTNPLVKNIDQTAGKKDVNKFNILTQPKINQQLNELEMQLDKELKDNITNSKSKKYNTLKHYFEATIKYIPQIGNSRILQKILYGYHEVVSNFSIENKNLKEHNAGITNKLEKVNKTLFEYEKRNSNQQNEINKLNKRIAELERAQEQVISKSTENSTQIQGSCNTEKEQEQFSINSQDNKHKHVLDINKKNIEDLDALYFFDKVKIPRASSFSQSKIIPKLKLN